nr:leucyl/phenylalanyl-tRNA--protein transferase [uncultured Mucilaginibacter sp.]
MVFGLNEDIIFPPVELAQPDGLLAVGGDLSVPRLQLAYKSGIFPWYSDGTPILWYAPHERFVLYPDELRVSKSMQKIIRQDLFTVTTDKAFADVINACSHVPRPGQDGTWITDDMKEAYVRLHQEGVAHSVEVWQNDELVGGAYGVVVGNVFCGESMFAKVSNASKLALISLCQSEKYKLIDCQVYTEHLESMGARMISREEYMALLTE